MRAVCGSARLGPIGVSASGTGGRVETRGTIRIEAERCKGCELCIPACPPRVLRMSAARNTRGLRVPELLAGCTGCGACLLVCPDFCIEVYQYDAPRLVEAVP